MALCRGHAHPLRPSVAEKAPGWERARKSIRPDAALAGARPCPPRPEVCRDPGALSPDLGQSSEDRMSWDQASLNLPTVLGVLAPGIHRSHRTEGKPPCGSAGHAGPQHPRTACGEHERLRQARTCQRVTGAPQEHRSPSMACGGSGGSAPASCWPYVRGQACALLGSEPSPESVTLGVPQPF